MSNFPASGDRLERRRLGLFLGLAFGIAWVTAGLIYATGGLTESPTVVEAGPVSLSLATVLLPTAYMLAPGVANVLTRLLTGEGWDDLMLSVGFAAHWQRYVLAWFAPGVLTAIGAAIFFLAFPEYFDPTAEAFATAAGGGADVGASPLVLVAITVGAAVLVNPLINTVFGLGEEFGWRAYLLPKLAPLGLRRAVVVHGLIWGAWHWPLIGMGYEYGFDYPGFPWTGFVVFLVFTVATGTFLAWLTVETGSVWPASLGHGAINATAVVAVVFSQGEPSYLLGPLPIGLVAGLPWLAVAGYLLTRMRDSTDSPRSVPGPTAVPEE